MKIDKLETHDRLQHLHKTQAEVITEGLEECLKRNPLSLALQSRSPYIYIFAHVRTMEDRATKKMIWQPRLSKPEAQENSYLFRVKSHTEDVEIMWMIPDKALWGQHKKGNMTEHEIVEWSINQFKTNKKRLESPEAGDLSDHIGMQILEAAKQDNRTDKMMMESVSAMLEREKMLRC